MFFNEDDTNPVTLEYNKRAILIGTVSSGTSSNSFRTKIDPELKYHEMIVIVAEKRRFIHPAQSSAQNAIDPDFWRRQAEHGEEESTG
jgi:hypothetical protein